MPWYNTKNGAYESVNTELGESIRALDLSGHPIRKGPPYLVLGFLPPDSNIQVHPYDDSYRFSRSSIPLTPASLPLVLEKDSLIGRRIVARRIDGAALAEVLVTEPLFCPHPPKIKK